jgi:quercetin dioxygenase-like cupin family protein
MTNLMPELRTLHIHRDDVPFVPHSLGLEIRYLQFRPADNISVVELRAQPGASTPLHRHDSPVLGITTLGAWGHDTEYEYRPGSYIFETPGVVHQFMNGPEVSQAYFISTGSYVEVDPDTREPVDRPSTGGSALDFYFQQCESMGLPRPNVLE